MPLISRLVAGGSIKCGTELIKIIGRKELNINSKPLGHQWTDYGERIVTGYQLWKVLSSFIGKRELATVCVSQAINIGVWNNSSEKEPVEGPGICILRGTGRVRPREIGRKDPGHAFSPFNRTQ